MPPLPTLLLFAVATLALLLVPGPSVLFIVARTLEHGRRGGLVSMLGVETGALLHVACATAGLGALVAASPDALHVAEARGRGVPARRLGAARAARRADARRVAAVVDALPETAMFSGVPQFIARAVLARARWLNPKTGDVLRRLPAADSSHSERVAPVWSQTLVLGLTSSSAPRATLTGRAAYATAAPPRHDDRTRRALAKRLQRPLTYHRRCAGKPCPPVQPINPREALGHDEATRRARAAQPVAARAGDGQVRRHPVLTRHVGVAPQQRHRPARQPPVADREPLGQAVLERRCAARGDRVLGAQLLREPLRLSGAPVEGQPAALVGERQQARVLVVQPRVVEQLARGLPADDAVAADHPPPGALRHRAELHVELQRVAAHARAGDRADRLDALVESSAGMSPRSEPTSRRRLSSSARRGGRAGPELQPVVARRGRSSGRGRRRARSRP